jgi:anti-sigma B factor antagonist
MEIKLAAGENPQDTICFAELSGGVVVIRILGRGSFANSVELKELAEHVARSHGPGAYHFIVDLAECSTMDSTFMGVLASVGLRQRREGHDQLTVVNANDQSRRLLQTLGLAHFITVRRGDGPVPDHQPHDQDFSCTTPREVSRAERIAHMIEAHQNLVDIDSDNAVRFESVLKYLNDSLNREKK